MNTISGFLDNELFKQHLYRNDSVPSLLIHKRFPLYFDWLKQPSTRALRHLVADSTVACVRSVFITPLLWTRSKTPVSKTPGLVWTRPQNPETSVQHWMKNARVCKESRNSLTFCTHTLITSKQITGEDGFL